MGRQWNQIRKNPLVRVMLRQAVNRYISGWLFFVRLGKQACKRRMHRVLQHRIRRRILRVLPTVPWLGSCRQWRRVCRIVFLS